MPTWEIPTADYPNMKSILMMMERIKDVSIQLEASDQPNFMILGHQVLHLLYTDQELNHTDGVAEQFATAFKNKLASAVDEPDLILEWGIAAILDPQQKLLGKFCHIFDPMCRVRWLYSCIACWDNHEEFVKEVTKKTIIYALDLVDTLVKAKWPWMVVDRAAFGESKMGCKR